MITIIKYNQKHQLGINYYHNKLFITCPKK